MQRILLTLKQALRQKIFVLGLMIFLSLSGLFIFVSAPAYATTTEEQKLVDPAHTNPTAEQKIERAYEFSETAGLLEQAKQESANANEITDVNDPMTIEGVETPQRAGQGSNLLEKAQKLIDKVTGKE